MKEQNKCQILKVHKELELQYEWYLKRLSRLCDILGYP